MKVYIAGKPSECNYRKYQPIQIWPISLEKHIIHFDILDQEYISIVYGRISLQ